ncbi:MAG TPA: type II secretion system protein [Verrucomicrobiae bacterium]|nr:type II secretion system protein [Verrucomicrobiae bacterium]
MTAFGQSKGIQADGFRKVCCVIYPARAGFSLIELLVVLALMLIMATMMYGFGSPSRQRAEKKACQQNLSKIYLAMQIYATDYAGKLPVNTNAQTAEEALYVLVPRYTTETSIFICPGGRDSALPESQSFRKRKISYAYFMGAPFNDAQQVLMSDRLVNTLPKNAGDDAFSTTGKPPGNNHHKYGGNFLFGDGSMQMTPPLIPFPLATNAGVVILNPRP